jgi:hypothetical protein
MKMQKTGGWASIVFVCVTIAWGAMVFISPMSAIGDSAPDPAKVMAALKSSPLWFYGFQLFAIPFGVAFLILALALKERMKANAPRLIRNPSLGRSGMRERKRLSPNWTVSRKACALSPLLCVPS